MKSIFLHFACLLSLFVHSAHVAAQHTLMKADIDSIIQLVQNEKYADFNAFLNDIELRSTKEAVRKLIGKSRRDGNLSDVDRIDIFRLTGIFVRCQYKDAMLALLKEWWKSPPIRCRVSINTRIRISSSSVKSSNALPVTSGSLFAMWTIASLKSF